MTLVLSDTARSIEYLPYFETGYLRCIEIGERDDQMTVTGTGSFKAWHTLGLYYNLFGDKEKAELCQEEEKVVSNKL